ncbi:UNVERIFIED_CONTAM: hypothetical protein GTU68_010787, partial [Idotea baltica]|nr:hypothetical protein [Idotea baltica]
SLHIAVSGLVEEQRNILLKNRKAEKKIRLPWMNVGCTNSLKDTYKFYSGKELQKESRDIFVKGSLSDVIENFEQLMQYCAQDVVATHEVLQKLFPLFLERFPHPVTLAGMLEMGTAYLPVCDNWNKYTNLSEEKFDEFNASLISELVKQTLEALKLKDGEYKSDPWLWDLDWNLPKAKVKKLQNFPNWYRKLCMKKKKGQETLEVPQSMSTSLKIVPKLLRLTWEGYPLHYDKNEGWGYLKPINISNFTCIDESDTLSNGNKFPFESLLKMTSTLKGRKNLDELPSVDIGIPNVVFHPLPHKNGEGNRVGNPLSKDFLRKLEDNTLSSAVSHVAQLVLKTTKTISYWKMNRDRILSQTVIQLKAENLPSTVRNSADFKNDEFYGAILPQVVTAGTITRRAVERTWMTASNAYSDRIGSELKAMIRAPPG